MHEKIIYDIFEEKYWEAIMVAIWFICHHCLILEGPAPLVMWLVDFKQRKLIYQVMPNLLKLGVASQKTFIMQESFKINKYINKERMNERKK